MGKKSSGIIDTIGVLQNSIMRQTHKDFECLKLQICKSNIIIYMYLLDQIQQENQQVSNI